MDNKRYQILNTYVDVLTMDETVLKVKNIIDSKEPTQHVVINASKINIMEKDIQLRNIVNNCSLINADGASIVWAGKKLGVPISERVTGIDLFLKLIEISNDEGYRVYLFGATEEVVVKNRNIFSEKYPNLNIVGYRNGFFSADEEEEIVKDIFEAKPDIVFVAFSSPKKEYWINKYLKEMNVPFVMGVGGSFDVVAGITKRAPKWMQKSGLEWFYRFIQEPRRMWQRYIIGNFKFVLLTYKYKRKREKK